MITKNNLSYHFQNVVFSYYSLFLSLSFSSPFFINSFPHKLLIISSTNSKTKPKNKLPLPKWDLRNAYFNFELATWNVKKSDFLYICIYIRKSNAAIVYQFNPGLRRYNILLCVMTTTLVSFPAFRSKLTHVSWFKKISQRSIHINLQYFIYSQV